MIPILSIVGKTNSGKTTLLEKLIPALSQRGYRIGALKHDAHRFEIDHEGKDSWRLTAAGAVTTVIASSQKIGMVRMINEEIPLDELARTYFPDVDLVLTEGYKRSDKPKIEVVREGIMLCGPQDNLIAIAARDDHPLPEFALDRPRFPANDGVEIASFIEERFLRSS